MRGEATDPSPPPEQAPLAVSGVIAECTPRLLYMDTLRGTLMLVGVGYHTLGVFSERRGAVAGGWVGWDMLKDFTHLWRMPAFFVVAGVFAAIVLTRRGAGSWWRRRVVRLGVPLVFGVVVVNSAALLLTAWHQGRLDATSSRAAWLDVVWPPPAHLLHVWFLLQLLIFCTLLAGGVVLARRCAVRLTVRRVADRLASRRLPLLALLVTASALAGAVTAVVDINAAAGGLLNTGFTRNLVFFAFGCLIGASPHGLHALVTRRDGAVLLLAMITATLLMSAGPLGVVYDHAAWWAMCTLCGLTWALVLMGFFHRWLQLDGWWSRYLIAASLPVYLVHYPVRIPVSGVVAESGLGPIAGGVVAVVLVGLVSFTIYELLNLSRWTRWLSTGHRERGQSVRDLRRP